MNTKRGLERTGLLLGLSGGITGGLMGYNRGHENMRMAAVGCLLGFFVLLILVLAIRWVARGYLKE